MQLKISHPKSLMFTSSYAKRLLFIFSMLVFINSNSARAQYKHLFDIGSDEPLTNNFTFFRPSAVAVDSEGNQYISDTDNDRIQIFSSEGKLIGKIGGRGSGDGEFLSPEGIALDATGNLYVCDLVNSRIQVFDSVGNFIRKFGTEGTGDGEFWSPVAIAIGNSGDRFNVSALNVITGISEESIKNNLTVLPNPSNGIFHIRNTAGRNVRLSVFDATGRTIFNDSPADEINKELSVDLTKSPPGIYLLQVTDENESRTIRLNKK
jgi:hypothetical protein